MPSNRRRTPRGRKIELPQGFINFLLYGDEKPSPDDKGCDELDVFMLKYDEKRIRELWEKHKKELLREWKPSYPGERPYCLEILEDEE